MKSLVPLPIDEVLPQIVAALERHAAVVVQAPTGAGKTTRVPPTLLDAGLAGEKRIVMLEPRRLAARAAARRMAQERGGEPGEEVGYQVRFDRCSGPRTRILVVTEGVLLRMLQDDPFLESIGVLVFDEFHERSLENDLALGMARLVQQTVRPELRIVAMSATLAVEAVSRYLREAPIVASQGRQFPVEVRYAPRQLHAPWPEAIAAAALPLLSETSGDLLVFLPGLQEIRQAARQLAPLAATRGLLVLPLHGDLPAEQQDAALLRQAQRKIVLATNVAETSVTVEGITGVVDTGLARIVSTDTRLGLDRLQLVPISQASAQQRAGRAGRSSPGVCVRLWSEAAHRQRPAETEPEVRRVDLAGAILQLLACGETDLERFPWFEPPPRAALEQSQALLRRLDALDDHGPTACGRLLARLPVHPRLGRLLLEAERLGHAERGAMAAALLSERDPFIRVIDGRPARRATATRSDVLERVDALEAFEQRGQTTASVGTLQAGSARFVLRARDQLLRALRQAIRSNSTNEVGLSSTPISSDEALLRALLAAFPDRLARRRELGSLRGVMIGGRGVRLSPASNVLEGELFLCLDVDAKPSETLVHAASAVEREWLPAARLSTNIEVEFDSALERVSARRRVRFDDLLLEESSAALPDDDQTARVLAAAAAERLERIVPPPDSPAGGFLLRVRCLRAWMPELGLPALDDAQLIELLPWLCRGCRSLDDLRKTAWLPALRGALSHGQLQAVQREAPERIEVPSGKQIALRYETGRPPILAARIQELFGLADTPRVAGGRVRVLLHLLAPNYRPQQITDDLASFWSNTYAQVRKELRARYPKHAWPEDPRAVDT